MDYFNSEFKENIIDLSYLTSNVHTKKLFIDSSAHPSLLGYIFINKILSDSNFKDIDKIALSFRNEIMTFMHSLCTEELIITGTSVFFDGIKLMISKEIIELLTNWHIIEAHTALEHKNTSHMIHFNALSYNGENNASWVTACNRQVNFIKEY